MVRPLEFVLLSCTRVEIYVVSHLLPVSGRHRWLTSLTSSSRLFALVRFVLPDMLEFRLYLITSWDTEYIRFGSGHAECRTSAYITQCSQWHLWSSWSPKRCEHRFNRQNCWWYISYKMQIWCIFGLPVAKFNVWRQHRVCGDIFEFVNGQGMAVETFRFFFIYKLRYEVILVVSRYFEFLTSRYITQCSV